MKTMSMAVMTTSLTVTVRMMIVFSDAGVGVTCKGIDIPPVAGQHHKQVWQRPHLLPGQAFQQVLVKVRQLEQGYRAFRGSLQS